MDYYAIFTCEIGSASAALVAAQTAADAEAADTEGDADARFFPAQSSQCVVCPLSRADRPRRKWKACVAFGQQQRN